VKSSESSRTFKSFKELKALLNNDAFPSTVPEKPSPVTEPSQDKTPLEPITEEQLFMDAMADVTPLSGKTRAEIEPEARPPMDIDDDTDAETMRKLENLVKHGKGFVVSHTPEYIEGTGYQVHPEVTERLHRGDFSIQAHIDLHGLTAESARETFEKFIKTSIMTGKRAVLVVHGRGLSSPGVPVLKTKVYEWLTWGPWRKWIIAFSSARRCDGGAGATYILLRQRPLTKRFRKKPTATRKPV
jgi:DNA-nicking Smr family endonuclease